MTTITASLSSSAFFTPALHNLQNANNDLSASVARLSSGNRIINVGDDVAAFSVAAGLQSQLTGLRQATSNTAQGMSLLQVAAGGLQEISEIISNLKSTALQANNGSLTNTDRGYLQQQFASYLTSINSIVSGTTFNGLALIDGSMAGTTQLTADTTSAPKASATLTFSGNVTAGQTVILNGVTLTEGVEFAAGGTTALSIAAIVTAASNSTNAALSQATYASSGTDGLAITARTGGALGNQYVINQVGSTAAFTTEGGTTDVVNKFTLTGGTDAGVHINSTQASGTIGNNVINTQSQTSASVSLSVSGDISDGETLSIDNGHGGLVAFTFRNTASLSKDIQIASTTEETLQNAVKTLSQYSDTDNYGTRQLSYAVNGSNLVITNRTVGNATETDGSTALNISKVIANGTLSGASFNNGVTTGVNVSGVTNSGFTGTIQGFTATYNSADNVTLGINVGGRAYTGTVTDTTPAGNATVRLKASGSDYFDVQLAGGNGSAVTNQTDANNYAGRLDAAFASLTFSQARPISNFSATNSFSGTSASIQLSSFASVPEISDIAVTAPASQGADGSIEFTINGTAFSASSGLGGSIGANETVKFTNIDDSNQFLSFTNGSTALDFSTSSAATTLQTALRTAFDVGTGTDFRVGPQSTDVINVAIGSAHTDALFNGADISVSSQANAAIAETAIAAASSIVQGLITGVGANQSRFDFVAANLAQSINGIAAAHSALADTDIAAESTTFATDTLKVNVASAVIAQALSLQSGLLTLVRAGLK